MIDHVVVHPDAESLAAGAAARLVTALIDAQSVRDLVHVALTGGGIGTAVMAAVLAEPAHEGLDLDRIHWWWSDERFVPAGDAQRNDTAARAAMLDALAPPDGTVHPMPALEDGLSPEAAAARYAQELARYAEAGADAPLFDVMLLGLGPDAHVASLFPGHAAALADGPAVLAVHDAPKPPPTRLSFASRMLHQQARHVWLLASGQEKAKAAHTAVRSTKVVPAQPVSVVQGTEETLLLADVQAAPWYGG